MSRQLDQKREERQSRLDGLLVAALEFALIGSCSDSGADLVGLSIRFAEADYLMTLRAEIEGVRQVAFVGSEDLPSVFRKAVNEANRGNLNWREDNYR
jgi:hypothetical protein